MRKKRKRRRKGGDEGRKENKESATCGFWNTPVTTFDVPTIQWGVYGSYNFSFQTGKLKLNEFNLPKTI